MTAGRGWIALALVVFATWSPIKVLIGALIFGGITILQLHMQAIGFRIPVQFLSALPYLMTIIVLVVICLLYTSPSPRDGLLSRMPSSA